MIDYIEESLEEELKRADHLIYVSLKYTRTADVMKNIIKRLINAFDFGILELLEEFKEQKKIILIPKSPVARVEALEKLLKRKEKEYLKLYKLLKKINNLEHTARNEYRKGVTLIVKDKKPIEITTDMIKHYFEKTKDFIKFIEEFKR